MLSIARRLPADLLGGSSEVADNVRGAAEANKTLLKSSVLRELDKKAPKDS